MDNLIAIMKLRLFKDDLVVIEVIIHPSMDVVDDMEAQQHMDHRELPFEESEELQVSQTTSEPSPNMKIEVDSGNEGDCFDYYEGAMDEEATKEDEEPMEEHVLSSPTADPTIPDEDLPENEDANARYLCEIKMKGKAPAKPKKKKKCKAPSKIVVIKEPVPFNVGDSDENDNNVDFQESDEGER